MSLTKPVAHRLAELSTAARTLAAELAEIRVHCPRLAVELDPCVHQASGIAERLRTVSYREATSERLIPLARTA